LSGEHILSASILRLLDDESIGVRGAAWLKEGESRALSIASLTANILCERHNSALSCLDDGAVEFFRNIRTAYDDIADGRSLSHKKLWFLISGEELELWFLKTAYGLYCSRSLAGVSRDGAHLLKFNPMILNALAGAPIVHPCGLYVSKARGVHDGRRNEINLTPLTSARHDRVTGLTLQFMGLTLLFLHDMRAEYDAFEEVYEYRPNYLQFRNNRRSHTTVLTWLGAEQREHRALLYSKLPTYR
jgi:hypothetical protein